MTVLTLIMHLKFKILWVAGLSQYTLPVFDGSLAWLWMRVSFCTLVSIGPVHECPKLVHTTREHRACSWVV